MENKGFTLQNFSKKNLGGFALQNFSKKNLGGFANQNPAPYKEEAGLGGFTLIELLVTISIIVILTGIVLVSYQSGKKQFALQRAANKLAQDIRRAEEMALAAETCCTSPATVPAGGYGIYLQDANDTYYHLYADIYPVQGNEQYDFVNDRVIETITLEQGVKILPLSPSSLSINFKPPNPTIALTGGSNEVTITIALITDTSKTKKIKVNKAGLISIE